MSSFLQSRFLTPDPSLKNFFRSKSRFADMINSTCFHGQTVLRADDLLPDDTDLSLVFDISDEPISFNSYRDVIMRADRHGVYMLVALENQKAIDYHMPLRSFLYDAFSYKRQHQNYLDEKKQNSHTKLKLIPIFTIVLYFGEQKWTGPRTLLDMMEIPEPFQSLVNNWNIHLIDMKEVDIHLLKDKDNRDFVEGLQNIYGCGGEINQIRERYISREAAIALASLIDQNQEILKIIEEKKEEKVNMCQAIELIKTKALEEGIEKGIEKGIIQGKTIMLIAFLKNKFGQLSEETMNCIEKCTGNQIDQITGQFSQIHTEADIFNILSHEYKNHAQIK